MRLKLSDLQRVVEETTREKEAVDSFCNEIKAAFGPTVMAADDLETLVEQAHYRLDVLERTGRINYISFPTAAAVSLSNHKNADVRRLVARLLPEELSAQFLNDKSPSVRVSAARRVPFKLLKETVSRRPSDAALQDALELRALTERADSALEAAAESPEGSDMLSDGWYKKTAHKLIQDYGRTLDTGWVPAAVNQLCSAMRASNRFNIDAYKLMKRVVECLAEIEEERRESLRESFQSAPPREHREILDPIQQLVESRLSAQEYIREANRIFSISMSSIPRSLQKFYVNEGTSRQVMVPTSGTLPRSGPFAYADESALDTYVKHWNTLHSLRGNVYRLAWSPHPESQNRFSFNLVLR